MADKLVKGNRGLLPEELISLFGAFPNAQMDFQGSTITASMDMAQTSKASTSVTSSEELQGPLQRKAPFVGSDR